MRDGDDRRVDGSQHDRDRRPCETDDRREVRKWIERQRERDPEGGLDLEGVEEEGDDTQEECERRLQHRGEELERVREVL
jgi:hypothetical protein